MTETNRMTTEEKNIGGKQEPEVEVKGGIITMLLRLLRSDSKDDNALKQWKSVQQQLSIDGQWLKRQLGVVGLVVIGIVVYITLEYQAQQDAILIENLKKERTDWRYRSLTRSSELTLKTRQSIVEKSLKHFGDSTLKSGVQPPITTTVTTR